MPIDPSISLQVRPVEMPNMLAQYAQMMGIQQAQNQNRLADLQYQNALRQQQDEVATQEAFKGAGNDLTGARNALMSKGLYKPALALDEAERKRNIDAGNIAKTNAEVLEKALKIHKDQLGSVTDPQQAAQWVMSGFNDPTISPILKRIGSPEELLRRIPQEPRAFEDWKLRNGLGLEKFQADLRAQQGQAITVRGQDMTDARTRAEGAANRGVTMRGQNLTDTRARESQAQAGRTYDAERGIVVNTRDATAAPVMTGGAPLGAKIPESSKKELAGLDAQGNTVRAAIEGVQKTPSAFGFKRGMATMAGAIPETLAGRMDSKQEREARSFVFNVVSKVINERAGAAQSAQELARLRSFLPAEADEAEQIIDKLEGFEKYIGEQRKAFAVAPGTEIPQRRASDKDSGVIDFSKLPKGR